MNPFVKCAIDAQLATHKKEKRNILRRFFLSINVWMMTTLRKLLITNIEASMRNLREGICRGKQGECGEVTNSQTSTRINSNGGDGYRQ